jgi:hypothetical protein
VEAFFDLLPWARPHVSVSHRWRTSWPIHSDGEILCNPAKVCLALSLSPVWYVMILWCHGGGVSSGSPHWPEPDAHSW